MAGSINYEHFKNVVEAYERTHLEKSKNTSRTAVGKVWKKMKADFFAPGELEEVVRRRQANKLKTLSFAKKSLNP